MKAGVLGPQIVSFSCVLLTLITRVAGLPPVPL